MNVTTTCPSGGEKQVIQESVSEGRVIIFFILGLILILIIILWMINEGWLTSKAQSLFRLEKYLHSLIDAHHLLAQFLVALVEHVGGFFSLLIFFRKHSVNFNL